MRCRFIDELRTGLRISRRKRGTRLANRQDLAREVVVLHARVGRQWALI